MISVVVPVHNGRGFVPGALASIEAQELADLEVTLVDDGSTDGLNEADVRAWPQVRYLRQGNRGPAAARNLGIQHAQGDLLAFLDVDDRWTPGHLNRLERALEQRPEAGIAQGRIRQVVAADSGSETRSGPYRMPYLGSCVFRRWVLDRCGLLDETMQFGEDYDLIVRCWEHDVPKVHIDEVSLLYRRHGGNMTRGNYTHAHVVVMKRRLERIRAGIVSPSQPRRASFQDYIGDTREFDQWER